MHTVVADVQQYHPHQYTHVFLLAVQCSDGSMHERVKLHNGLSLYM